MNLTVTLKQIMDIKTVEEYETSTGTSATGDPTGSPVDDPKEPIVITVKDPLAETFYTLINTEPPYIIGYRQYIDASNPRIGTEIVVAYKVPKRWEHSGNLYYEEVRFETFESAYAVYKAYGGLVKGWHIYDRNKKAVEI